MDAADKNAFGAIYISGNWEGLEELGHGMVLVMTTVMSALKPGMMRVLYNITSTFYRTKC